MLLKMLLTLALLLVGLLLHFALVLDALLANERVRGILLGRLGHAVLV
jgi:hypothetical protein